MTVPTRGTPLSARALRRLATKGRTGRYRGVEHVVGRGGFEAVVGKAKQRRRRGEAAA